MILSPKTYIGEDGV
jgi:hypothetical protein